MTERLWKRLIDVPLLVSMIRHTTGAIAAVTLVWGLTWYVKFLGTEPSLAQWLDAADIYVLKGTVIILIVQLAVSFAKIMRKEFTNGWNETNIFLAL